MDTIDYELKKQLYDLITNDKFRAQEDVVEQAVAKGYNEDAVRLALADCFEAGALVACPVELLPGKVKDFEPNEEKLERLLKNEPIR